MKVTTLSFTLEVEDHINPLLLSDAVVQTLELCGAEVLEDSATNVSEEDNLNWHSANFGTVPQAVATP
jgi:hypothetical protein